MQSSGDVTVTRTHGARTRAGFSLSEPVERFPGVLLEAVERLPQLRSVDIGDPGRMRLRRRVNWSTWGTYLDVSWYPISGGVHVDVEVTLVLPSTVQDWGQGRRDVRALFEAVRASVSARARTAS